MSGELVRAEDGAGSSEQKASRRPRRLRTITAGWLTLGAGLIALTNGATAFMNQTTFLWLDIDIALNEYTICSVIVILFGVMAIVGGMSALRGKHVALALPGAACGMLGDGIAGFFLGLAAIILLFYSDEDI